MSVVPWATLPGIIPSELRTALAWLLPTVSVPVTNALAGLDDWAVKFAPDPAVRPAAARTAASAPRERRGVAARA